MLQEVGGGHGHRAQTPDLHAPVAVEERGDVAHHSDLARRDERKANGRGERVADDARRARDEQAYADARAEQEVLVHRRLQPRAPQQIPRVQRRAHERPARAVVAAQPEPREPEGRGVSY